jgi:hypothetical protein
MAPQNGSLVFIMPPTPMHNNQDTHSFHLRIVTPVPSVAPRGDTGRERRRWSLHHRHRCPPLVLVLPRPLPPSLWQGEQGSIPLVDRVIIEFV